MAKFRQVFTSFWQDSKVVEEMTPEDKYFYLYLLTNPNTTQIGVYQITMKKMAFDLGYSTESIISILDRFENHHQIVKYNPSTREIAIVNWGKYNLNNSGKPVIDLLRKELKEVKDTSLLFDIAKRIQNTVVVNEFMRYVDNPLTEGTQEEEEQQEQQEQQLNKEKRSNPHHFYQSNIGPLNPYIADEINNYCNDLSEELVIKALKMALDRQQKWNFAKGILKNWINNNVRTVMDAEAAVKEYYRRKSSFLSKDDIKPNDIYGKLL